MSIESDEPQQLAKPGDNVALSPFDFDGLFSGVTWNEPV